MERDFWTRRWREKRIGFHLDEPNPALREHGGMFAECSNVLVPLAGRALDLLWLRDNIIGRVVGVEWAEEAVADFWLGQGTEPERESIDGFVRTWVGDLEMWQGDFFSFHNVWRAHQGSTFDGVYDRAAMVAVEPERRPAYAEVLSAVTDSGARLLGVTLEHPNQSGPPFSIPDQSYLEHLDDWTLRKVSESPWRNADNTESVWAGQRR